MRIGAIVFGASLLLAAPGARAEEPRSPDPGVRGAPSRVGSAGPAAPEARRVAPRHRESPRYDHRSSPRVRLHVGGYYGYPSRYYGWGPGWSLYWDPWRYGYGYGPGWGYTTYPRAGVPGMRYGALDTDIVPERAEVWVDGQRVGVADDFDGFPDYLWLEEGTYDVVFFSPGRRTLARQYSVYAGLVIDVEDRLEEGEAVHPLDLGPKTHERRDERLRRDRETRENAERLERERSLDRPAEPLEPLEGEAIDARGEPGRIALTVSPGDASVYLDGRFLGSGSELERLRAGLLVDPGEHRLEVVRPGYRPAELAVTVGEGDEERVEVELDREAGGDAD
jgi:hypothetical protein